MNPKQLEYAIFPDDGLRNLADVRGGATEPWTLEIVASLLRGRNALDVLEIGTYVGYGTEWLLRTMAGMLEHRRSFTGLEIDPSRHAHTVRRVATLELPPWIATNIVLTDSRTFLPNAPKRSFDFAWVDGSHAKEHVTFELEWLVTQQRVREGGMICMHDVIGSFELGDICRAYGGYVIPLPLFHAAGGLGIIVLEG